MDIFLLFIFNIFTGAVIYLILSLKIEKTSATFQEQKLRREMGEIITEFNSTAERNITLLESRISVLKKLLNDNGSLKGIDFTVLDDKMRDNINQGNAKPAEKALPVNHSEKERKREIVENKIISPNDQHNIIGTFMDKIQSFNKVEDNTIVKDKTKKTPVNMIRTESEASFDSFSIIERDAKVLQKKPGKIDLSADEEIVLTYEKPQVVDTVDTVNIEELFHDADDKYLLIAKLFSEGHSVEELSKHSGLPAGEIKLVISLNS